MELTLQKNIVMIGLLKWSEHSNKYKGGETMFLKEKLIQEKEMFVTNLHRDVQMQILWHIKELQQSDIGFGLKEGENAPDYKILFELPLIFRIPLK